jgi:phosphoribosyl 1,2-cyclic phosphodiesterase
LFVLRFAIAKSRDTDTIRFTVLFLMSAGSTPVPIEIKAVCGPGDDGEPVLTIMLPDED